MYYAEQRKNISYNNYVDNPSVWYPENANLTNYWIVQQLSSWRVLWARSKPSLGQHAMNKWGVISHAFGDVPQWVKQPYLGVNLASPDLLQLLPLEGKLSMGWRMRDQNPDAKCFNIYLSYKLYSNVISYIFLVFICFVCVPQITFWPYPISP